MNELDYLKKVLTILEDHRDSEVEFCSSYTDSGDRGMCATHRIKPVSNLIDLTELKIQDAEGRSY